jgi:hypothetical protein
LSQIYNVTLTDSRPRCAQQAARFERDPDPFRETLGNIKAIVFPIM